MPNSNNNPYLKRDFSINESTQKSQAWPSFLAKIYVFGFFLVLPWIRIFEARAMENDYDPNNQPAPPVILANPQIQGQGVQQAGPGPVAVANAMPPNPILGVNAFVVLPPIPEVLTNRSTEPINMHSNIYVNQVMYANPISINQSKLVRAARRAFNQNPQDPLVTILPTLPAGEINHQDYIQQAYSLNPEKDQITILNSANFVLERADQYREANELASRYVADAIFEKNSNPLSFFPHNFEKTKESLKRKKN